MASAHLRKTFSVVRIGHVWRVIIEGSLGGHYQFRVDAEEAALRLARAEAARGEAFEVIVQETWGEMSPLPVA